MKSWKKRLNEEFESLAPEMSDEVKNAPIITSSEFDEIEVAARYGNIVSLETKRKIGLFSAAILLISIVFAILASSGVFTAKPPINPFNRVFSYEINPAVAFITDSDGVVLEITALNPDADVLLSDEAAVNRMKNVDISQAIVSYTEAAAKLGFIDVEALDDAVRLSGTEESGEILKNATSALENFFTGHGIYAAVVTEEVTVSELGARVGKTETYSSVQDLSESLKTDGETFYGKIDPNTDAETIKNLYENEFIGENLYELVRNELVRNVNRVKEASVLIGKIKELSDKIIEHDDNPAIVFKDYWNVKEFYKPSVAVYKEEFAALMSEMDAALEEYSTKLGGEISSKSELNLLCTTYEFFNGADLEALINSLTLEQFVPSASKFVSLLKTVYSRASVLENIISSIPETVSEYVEAMKQAVDFLRLERTEKFASVYESEREVITASDYKSFIDGLKDSYGSLSDFWNAKRSV